MTIHPYPYAMPEPIMMPACKASLAEIDPTGEFARNGIFTDLVPVAESFNGQGDKWTVGADGTLYRVCRQRNFLYRKVFGSEYMGGYCIQRILLAGRGLKVAHEWLFGTVGELKA